MKFNKEQYKHYILESLKDTESAFYQLMYMVGNVERFYIRKYFINTLLDLGIMVEYIDDKKAFEVTFYDNPKEQCGHFFNVRDLSSNQELTRDCVLYETIEIRSGKIHMGLEEYGILVSTSGGLILSLAP